jgi:hypothetical protein
MGVFTGEGRRRQQRGGARGDGVGPGGGWRVFCNVHERADGGVWRSRVVVVGLSQLQGDVGSSWKAGSSRQSKDRRVAEVDAL